MMIEQKKIHTMPTSEMLKKNLCKNGLKIFSNPWKSTNFNC